LPDLSEASRELLMEASKDEGGTIISFATMSGYLIQTNGREFVTTGENREIARWKGAIDQLRTNGLIEDRGHKGQVFAVTNRGYEIADLLTGQ
jgi:hypothetical protein